MTNGKLDLVPYDPVKHRAALLQFLREAFAPDKLERRVRVLEWLQDHMPGRERTPLRHVILNGDRVAGSMGFLPSEFLVDGRIVSARFTHDLLVDPTYRGQGLAKRIVQNALGPGEFLPGGMWMTDPCYRIHLACGFDDVRPLTTHTLVLDPKTFANRKGLRGLRGGLSAAGLNLLRDRGLRRARRLHGKSRDLAVRAADRFDPSLDDLWRDMLSTYGAGRLRTADYLNWRYADHPCLDYRLCLAEREGSVAGYIVWRLAPEGSREKRAVIVDFLVAREDAESLGRLISNAVVDASDAGMETVSVITTQSWAVKILRSMSFLPRKERHTWVVGCWREHLPEKWLSDHSPWHICLGDSDGDLWTGGQ